MKKLNKDSKIVKWVLLLALIFGAIVYAAQPTVYHTLGAIFMGGMAVHFYMKNIRKKK